MATMHNHAKFKVSKNGTWTLWRSLHLGTRGWAGSEYYLERTSDGKMFGFDRQRDIPAWFEQAGIEKPEWTSHSDYKEIMHG